MAVTAGAITVVSTQPGSTQLSSAPATAGTGPYTYQWYRGTSSGFTPGAGNILPGKTALQITDTTVTPNTAYYYKVIATDTGAGNATSTSSAAAAPSGPATLQMNQIGQMMTAGVVDPRMAPATVSVQIDQSQSGILYPGAAVKFVDSAGGIPKVVGCTANSDDVAGFLNFDTLHAGFQAGDAAEMSMSGNGIYLYATAPCTRGGHLQLDLTTQGGVTPVVNASGAAVVGWAYDKATAAGQLIRVILGRAVGAIKA